MVKRAVLGEIACFCLFLWLVAYFLYVLPFVAP